MSKTVIFGFGQYYQRRKMIFKNENVIAILDNNKSIWGKHIDDIEVCSPDTIKQLNYDNVCIMAGHKYAQEMKEQLLCLGVPTKCIYLNHRIFFKQKQSKNILCIGKNDMISNKVAMFLPTLENTGGFRAALYALDVLIELYGGVTVICPCDGESRSEVTDRGGDVIIASDISLSNSILWKLIENADIYFLNALYYGYLIPEIQESSRKILWWLHTGDSFYDVYPLPDEKIKNAIVMGVSSPVQKAYQKHSNGEEIGLLPFGIPDQKVESNQKKQSSRVIFATVGSICRVKGIDVLIEAIRKLSNSDRSMAEFWLIGHESERIYADRMHEISKDIPEIKWLGGFPHEEILNMYADIDVLISSSREDMLPIVTCEALMNGKVCIASDAIGTAGFMTDGVDGLVFPTENAGALAEEIAWCIANRDKLSAIGEQGRKLYEKNFTVSAFQNKLKKILQA